MDKNKNPQYGYWNGKNIAGTSAAGSRDLIEEGPRSSKTGAKYDVSNETLGGDDIQKRTKQ